MSERLTDRYRPRTLADLCGQGWVVDQLQTWLGSPQPNAFIFAGPSGVGKTSAAIALGHDLGIPVHLEEIGGLWPIASGEQTGETVRRMMERMRLTNPAGSGWKLVIVNEADCMTANAAYIWLDALENLPPKTVVVFTTNELRKLPQRLRDRCEVCEFQAGGLLLRADLQDLANRVWRAETGRDDCPDVDTFGPVGDERGDVSFRRLLQNMEPLVRQAKAGRVPVARPEPPVAASPSRRYFDIAAILRRRANGESWGRLAAEVGLPVTTVRGRCKRALTTAAAGRSE